MLENVDRIGKIVARSGERRESNRYGLKCTVV